MIKNIRDVLPKYKFRIGVMGSASGELMRDKNAVEKCVQVGRFIAGSNATLVNGACPGLPDIAAMGAKQVGGQTFGVSPAISIRSHVNKYKSPIEHYDQFLFTGLGLMERDILNIRSCNGVIILPGGTGTLNEFLVAYDEGKPIGVLTGCGGCAEHIKEILAFCKRDVTDRMVFSDNPKELVEKLTKIMEEVEVSATLDDYLVGDEGVVTEIENSLTITIKKDPNIIENLTVEEPVKKALVANLEADKKAIEETKKLASPKNSSVEKV
jgi:uncharacterized protein (TIGR00725 family)